jgi:hypothetical protein
VGRTIIASSFLPQKVSTPDRADYARLFTATYTVLDGSE